MAPNDDLERYEAGEGRRIIQLLESVRSLPPAQAPPDFRAKVLARLTPHHPFFGSLAGFRRLWTRGGVPALAFCLLVSVIFNVWLGLDVLRSRGEMPPPGRTHTVDEIAFNSHRFQSHIQSQTDLGTLAATYPAIMTQPPKFGFAEKTDRARFYIIGSLYAEALAYLRSGDRDAAQQRLASMKKELETLGSPEVFPNFLDFLSGLVQSQHYPAAMLANAFSFFQPHFEAYAKVRGGGALPLFRVGTWLVDMTLAAAAADRESMKRGDMGQYFMEEMRRQEAPQGALDALAKIQVILAKPQMTDGDLQEFLTLTHRLQQMLLD